MFAVAESLPDAVLPWAWKILIEANIYLAPMVRMAQESWCHPEQSRRRVRGERRYCNPATARRDNAAIPWCGIPEVTAITDK